MAEAPHDNNRTKALLGTSNADGLTTVPVYADPATGRLLVNALTSPASEYTEGDTDATISGMAILWEDAADTLRAVSATKPLPVDIVDATGVTISADTEFPTAGVLSDNFANPTTTNVASMLMLWDTATWDRAPGDATNGLLVNLGTNNDVTVTSGTITSITNAVAVTGTFWQATQPVSLDSVPSNDVTNAGTFAVQQTAGAPQAYGIDTTGADTYATIVTASAARTRILITLQGANDAIVSVDGGTTDHIYIPAGSVISLDNLAIANGVAVQAKNASAGNNYSNLSVTIW